jgi:hypothetical protein
MTKKRTVVFIFIMVWACAIAQASSITIENSSFESPTLPCSGSIHRLDGDFITLADDWNITKTGVGAEAGEWHPLSHYSPMLIPDGNQVMFLYHISSMEQTLSDVLAPETTYNFSVYVGHRSDEHFPSYSVELLAGNTTIASVSNYDPGSGLWGLLTFQYTSTASDPIGQHLGIRFEDSDAVGQVNFDKVQLSASSTAVPEPASLSLLCSGIIGLAVLRKKYNKA